MFNLFYLNTSTASKKKLKAKRQAVKLRDNMHKPISATMERIQLSLQGHFNYYGVSGNLVQIYKFWKYVKYEYYKVLNKRHQKRSMKYLTYLRIWNYYIKEPHLTKNIWNWQTKLVWRAVCGKTARTVLWGATDRPFIQRNILEGVSSLSTRLILCLLLKRY